MRLGARGGVWGGGVRTTEIFDFGSFLGGKILQSIFWGSLI